jgi:hypothetical protein
MGENRYVRKMGENRYVRKMGENRKIMKMGMNLPSAVCSGQVYKI